MTTLGRNRELYLTGVDLDLTRVIFKLIPVLFNLSNSQQEFIMIVIKGVYAGYSNGFIIVENVTDESGNYYPKMIFKADKPNCKINSFITLKIS